jgi:hypothetical protein
MNKIEKLVDDLKKIVEQELGGVARGSYTFDSSLEYESVFNGDMLGWAIVRDGEWEQDGKYQWSDVITKHIETGICYMLTMTRSGSPFTDWHYDEPGSLKVREVVPSITIEATWR